MPYCNGMLFGSDAQPCSPECDCTSTQWGTGMCVKQKKCVGQITDECRDQDDCGEGEVCGMASGCDAFVCLSASACAGQGPWLLPDEPEDDENSPSNSTPDNTIPDDPITDDTGSEDTPTNDDSATVGWILVLNSEEPSNYWINDWSEEDIFIDIGGKKSVQTRCVTVSETSYAAMLPDSSKIEPDGNTLGFDSTPDSGSNACCFKWFADSKCTETSGEYGKLCGDGTAKFDFAVKSWKVYNCKGAWTGPPTFRP